ncbi:class I SAM-dependent methyltransferase [Brevibacterium casei]|uniref:class I SAM-dependent methyltransferase n=1 Tax=Brevibacterium casei TaxID=33889 RepID=UPI000B0CA508|nr:class I SAM-dependent methyltransferase [Brevibacterium casei]MCT2183969.1 class I SAM-dependent methyltransferase [Brevibacterium casei]
MFKPTFDSHFIVNELLAARRLEAKYGELNGFVPLDGWSLPYQAILHVANYCSNRESPRLLELGSGAGTVWLAKVLSAYGGELVSLEHDRGFYEKVSELLIAEDLISYVDYHLAPLVVTPSEGDWRTDTGATGAWYDVVVSTLGRFDAVIVDGPPGTSSEKARSPVRMHLNRLLKSSGLVVVDDIDRPDDAALSAAIASDFEAANSTVICEAFANTSFIYLSRPGFD